MVDERGRDEIGRHVGLRSRWGNPCEFKSRRPHSARYWGIRFMGRQSDEHKSFVATWIEVMRKNPEFAAKIRNDQLLEADLFEARRQCRNIIAVHHHKIEFYRSPSPNSGGHL